MGGTYDAARTRVPAGEESEDFGDFAGRGPGFFAGGGFLCRRVSALNSGLGDMGGV